MSCYNIMAILVNHRTKSAVNIQEVLTRHGCAVKMRLGLHETGDFCSEDGLIILQLCGESKEIGDLKKELNSIEGVKAEVITLKN